MSKIENYTGAKANIARRLQEAAASGEAVNLSQLGIEFGLRRGSSLPSRVYRALRETGIAVPEIQKVVNAAKRRQVITQGRSMPHPIPFRELAQYLGTTEESVKGTASHIGATIRTPLNSQQAAEFRKTVLDLWKSGLRQNSMTEPLQQMGYAATPQQIGHALHILKTRGEITQSARDRSAHEKEQLVIEEIRSGHTGNADIANRAGLNPRKVKLIKTKLRREGILILNEHGKLVVNQDRQEIPHAVQEQQFQRPEQETIDFRNLVIAMHQLGIHRVRIIDILSAKYIQYEREQIADFVGNDLRRHTNDNSNQNEYAYRLILETAADLLGLAVGVTIMFENGTMQNFDELPASISDEDFSQYLGILTHFMNDHLFLWPINGESVLFLKDIRQHKLHMPEDTELLQELVKRLSLYMQAKEEEKEN